MAVEVDVAIIGGGPAGYSAALRAVSSGKKAVLFEKERVGGVCLNRGCIPTKAAFEVARWAGQSKALGFAEIPKEKLWEKLLQRTKNAVEVNVTGLEALLRKRGVEVINQEARFISPEEIQAGREVYRFKHSIICTGSVPSHPDNFPEGLISEESWFFMEKLPSSAVIIGAGVAGLECAFVLKAVGCEVKIVEMAPQVLPFLDSDLAKTLERELKKQKIQVFTGFRVEKIDKKNSTFTVRSAEGKEIEAETVIVAVGRKPSISSLSPEKAGVEITPEGFVKTDKFGRTSNPKIYAAGDVTGPPFLAHRAYVQAEIAVEHMCGNEHKTPLFIPYAVFTEPEIAGAGALEKENPGLEKVKVPVRVLGKAHASGHTGGEVKILFEKETHLIRGVHLISHSASEIISALIPALEKGLTLEELASAVFVHPSFSEILGEVALSALGKPFHG